MSGLYFSNYFDVTPKLLKEYMACNISLVSDLLLFIDPFLLFSSKNAKYLQLHEEMIQYLVFLKDKAKTVEIDDGLLHSWYVFKEIKQNWLGFSVIGNNGSALGPDFGKALHKNLHKIFDSFGDEKITKGSHLEKLCLIKVGVGRDNISDFTTCLIKKFLLEFTQEFTVKHIKINLRKEFVVPRVKLAVC